MKKILRSIRKKKGDQGDAGTVNATPANATATPTTPATWQPPGPATPATARRASAIPATATTGRSPAAPTCTSIFPPHRWPAILSQPLLSAKEDPKDALLFRLPGVCPTCFNFDSSAAPERDSERHKPWGRAEYRCIRVDNSTKLLETANNGCIYCLITVNALEGNSPGWTLEKSFLYIFLANNLPVVLRLKFGSLAFVPMQRENALAMGINLAPGQTMQYEIQITSPEKPPIDVEIFRAHTDPKDLTLGDAAMSTLISHVGSAVEVGAHSGDQVCFDFIKAKVAHCAKNHRCEQAGGPLPMLPDRVIWIEADNASGIRLVEPKNTRGKYIALSYCWGPGNASVTSLTTASNIDAMKTSIKYEDVPRLFQDVFQVARVLGIEYVWIDRLCIVQGNQTDFANQAPKMGEIYGNATLAVAAACATTENDLILDYRAKKYLSLDVKVSANEYASLSLRTRQLSHVIGTEEEGGDYGKMSTRAWIWQERLLSARQVFFTPGAIKFECRAQSSWEGTGEGLTGPSWSAQLDEMTFDSWLKLVEEYMSRDITHSSDRLPAMDAVMKRIQKSTGWTPFWGLWANTLVEGLSWKVDDSGNNFDRHAAKMNAGPYAPSWSWASVDGPISYISAKPLPANLGIDKMQWLLECRSLNEASGLIRVSGNFVALELRCVIELREDPPAAESADAQVVPALAPPTYRYTYKMTTQDDTRKDGGVLVREDVALRPLVEPTTGRPTSVMRVPYGEPEPIASWSAPCGCLLLGKQPTGAVCLILGQSVRDGATRWERVGISTNVNAAIFERNRPLLVDIV